MSTFKCEILLQIGNARWNAPLRKSVPFEMGESIVRKYGAAKMAKQYSEYLRKLLRAFRKKPYRLSRTHALLPTLLLLPARS